MIVPPRGTIAWESAVLAVRWRRFERLAIAALADALGPLLRWLLRRLA